MSRKISQESRNMPGRDTGHQLVILVTVCCNDHRFYPVPCPLCIFIEMTSIFQTVFWLPFIPSKNACQFIRSLLSLLTVNYQWGKTLKDSIQGGGGCLNVKMSYRYTEAHYKDKTVWWPSHFFNLNTYCRKGGLYIETWFGYTLF